MLYTNPTLNAGGPISTESGALMRDARRLRRLGFGRAAEQAAAQSVATKQQERAFGNIGGARKLREFQAGLARTEAQAAEKLGQEQLAGRQAFAQELRGMAKAEPSKAYTYAQEQAGKYGLSQSQIASFFGRERLPMTSTPSAGTMSQPGTPNAPEGTLGATTAKPAGSAADIPLVGPPKPVPTTAESLSQRITAVQERLPENEVLLPVGQRPSTEDYEEVGRGPDGVIWRKRQQATKTAQQKAQTLINRR